MDLFAAQHTQHLLDAQPLAVRMRPLCVDEFVGQQHFLGEGKLLRRAMQSGRLVSMIFYGPAGTGKTSLAHIIAESADARFARVNATESGVKELRVILEAARSALETSGARTVLFVDEIHRFNKGQQDVLLGDVEDGIVILIGATTENPFHAINTPLISRSQIFQFQPLDHGDIKSLMHRALGDHDRGLGRHGAVLTDEAAEFLAVSCDGDARRALTALEIAVLSQVASVDDAVGRDAAGIDDAACVGIVVDLAVAAESIQRKAMTYDKSGDAHYDAISAMIKSIRGSDPDAAIYWLAWMLEGGEDPRFIARRIVIAASEDIGNAQPQALVVAQAAADATAMIGMPECQLSLAQAVTYLSCCPKSNASAQAIWSACRDVREGQTIPVPVSLRSSAAGRRLAHQAMASNDQIAQIASPLIVHDHASSPSNQYKPVENATPEVGHGVKAGKHQNAYINPHSTDDGIVAQDYLGVDKVYYVPTSRGNEKQLSEYLANVRQQMQRHMNE